MHDIHSVSLILCHENVNVNLQNINGYTPFSFACLYDVDQVVWMLIQDARVDVNLENQYGCSPLFLACANEFTNVVRIILSYGRWLNVNAKDITGITALQVSKKIDAIDIVNLIEEYHINPTEMQKKFRRDFQLKGI